MTLPPEKVARFKGADHEQPCRKVAKLRGIGPDGRERWSAWCFVHHHWLEPDKARETPGVIGSMT